MKHRQHNYLTMIHEIAGKKPFFYKDVGGSLKLKYGVNGAIMRKLVEDKVVKIVSKKHKRKNGQVMPQYQITNLGVEIVQGIRHRAGRYG
jgi:hypothetical protein